VGGVHDLTGALPEATLVVLKGGVEDVTLHRLHLAQHEAVAGDGKRQVERQPRLADLRLAGKDGKAFRDDARHKILDHLELHGPQRGGGEHVVSPSPGTRRRCGRGWSWRVRRPQRRVEAHVSQFAGVARIRVEPVADVALLG
jgi:hypothetical protein